KASSRPRSAGRNRCLDSTAARERAAVILRIGDSDLEHWLQALQFVQAVGGDLRLRDFEVFKLGKGGNLLQSRLADGRFVDPQFAEMRHPRQMRESCIGDV